MAQTKKLVTHCWLYVIVYFPETVAKSNPELLELCPKQHTDRQTQAKRQLLSRSNNIKLNKMSLSCPFIHSFTVQGICQVLNGIVSIF